MPIVKFQQDTSKPFGTGNFVDDQGRSMYLTDPQKASQFVDTLPGQGGGAPPAPSSPPVGVPQVAADNLKPDPNNLGDVELLGKPAPPSGPPGSPAAKVAAFLSLGGSKPAPGAPGAPPGPPATDAGKVQSALTSPAPLPPPAATPVSAPATAPAAPITPAGSLPPALPGSPGTLELAGSSTTNSSSTVKGRDKKNVAAQIAGEEKAGAETDTSLLNQASGADTRAAGALDIEKQGVSAAEERNRNQVIDEQLKQQTIKDKLDALNKELAANDTKLDPDQYMKRMSTGKKLGMVILAALNGGFGALAGQKPGENGVLMQVDHAIDENIKKQRDEIAAGRVRIGNDIAEFMRKGHDAETAEALARDRANAAVDNLFQLDAKRMGIQGANLEQAQALVAQRKEARAARRGDLIAQTEDRVQTQWQQTKTMQQKAAGQKPLSAKDYYETLSAEIKAKNDALESANAGDVGKVIGQAVSPQEAQKIKDRVKEVGAGINETSGAVDMTKNMVEALGGKLDVTTGKITWPSDLKGVGWWDSSNIVGKPLEKAGLVYTDATKAKDAQAALEQYITSNLTGATASPEQVKVFRQMAGADLGNEARAKEQLQNWANTLYSLRNDQMARLGPDGQKWFAYSQQQANAGARAPALQERGEQPFPGQAPAAPGAPAVPAPVLRGSVASGELARR